MLIEYRSRQNFWVERIYTTTQEIVRYGGFPYSGLPTLKSAIELIEKHHTSYNNSYTTRVICGQRVMIPIVMRYAQSFKS